MPYKRFNKKVTAIFTCAALVFAMAVTGITCSVIGTGASYTQTQPVFYDTRPATFNDPNNVRRPNNNTLSFVWFDDYTFTDGTFFTGQQRADLADNALNSLGQWHRTYTIDVHASSTSIAGFNNMTEFRDAVFRADSTLESRIRSGEINTIRLIGCNAGDIAPGNPSSVAQQVADAFGIDVITGEGVHTISSNGWRINASPSEDETNYSTTGDAVHPDMETALQQPGIHRYSPMPFTPGQHPSGSPMLGMGYDPTARMPGASGGVTGGGPTAQQEGFQALPNTGSGSSGATDPRPQRPPRRPFRR